MEELTPEEQALKQAIIDDVKLSMAALVATRGTDAWWDLDEARAAYLGQYGSPA
jgi:hypothetical protein